MSSSQLNSSQLGHFCVARVVPVGSTRYDKSRKIQNSEMKRTFHNEAVFSLFFSFTIFFIHATNFSGNKSTSLIADEIFLIFFFLHSIPFSMEKENIICIHLLFNNFVCSSFMFAVVGFISFFETHFGW